MITLLLLTVNRRVHIVIIILRLFFNTNLLQTLQLHVNNTGGNVSTNDQIITKLLNKVGYPRNSFNTKHIVPNHLIAI